MKLKELKLIVDSHCDHLREWNDPTVVVAVSKPSIGARASVGVKSAYVGIDWDSGLFIIHPVESLVPKKPKEALWDLASDFICMCACDRRMTKKGPVESALSKHASEILRRAGYVLDKAGRVIGVEEKEQPRDE